MVGHAGAPTTGRRSMLGAISAPFMPSLGRAGYDASDPEVAFRTQVVVLYAVTSSLVALGYAVSHWGYGAVGLAAFFVGFAVLTLAQLVVLRVTGRIRWVSHATLAVAVVNTTVATYFTGGLRMTNVCPFFIIIVASIFLLSWEGLGWSLACIAIPAAFEVGTAVGHRYPDLVPPAERATDALMTWIVGIVVVFLFVVCYEAARLLSLRRRMEAERARSLFLANVSHELRTPLHAIMGMTSRVLRGELSQEAQDSLRNSLYNADTLLVLINDLLDLASMHRDRFVLHEQDFDPVLVTERVSSALRFRCEEQGLAFRCSVDAGVPRWIRGDGDRLQQMLSNLGTNAVKYTAEGSVELAVRMDEPDDDRLVCRFSVRDTGVGIGQEAREEVFDPFTRLADERSGNREGAGLGLSIVREIAGAMGGRVELESEPGQGSAFHLVVPFAPACSEPPSATTSEPADEQAVPLRVLLVDDDRVNLEMAQIMLQDLDHEVVVAKDGQEGIDLWRAERPDLVLMDLQMPGMNGLEAIRAIRGLEEDDGATPVPILALTGHGTAEHRERCLTAGADECLFKPFRFEDLRTAIASVTRRAS